MDDADAGPGARGGRLLAGEAILLGLVVVLGLVGILAWGLSRSRRDSRRVELGDIDPRYGQYVGARACRECHPGESAQHSRSGHARTLRLAARVEEARQLDGRTVEDPELPGISWQFAFHGDRLTAKRAEGDRVEPYPIEYALGSGHHAITFLTLLDRDPRRPVALEHRLTVFAHASTPGLTPGQSLKGHASGNTPHGRVHSSDDTLKCFGCHATVTSNRVGAVLDEATMIPNLSCERCHGPGRAHVEAARRGAPEAELAMPFGPSRASIAEELRLCGSCHRLPEMITPGGIRTDNPVLVRHQPVGLMQSACFVRSRGALGCTTCHDPHARTVTDRARYEPVCLRCHQSAGQTRCPVSPRSGCIDCHMPRRDVARGMRMTDHWIRSRPRPEPSAAPSPEALR